MKDAKLILEDGTVFQGKSFGYEADAVGEVVFNTAMTGYPESLTDPSYAGQILVMTYPLVGNYGAPSNLPEGRLPSLESERIHVKALVVADYSEAYSHWNAKESLGSWLQREHIECQGVTRQLAAARTHPRHHGHRHTPSHQAATRTRRDERTDCHK